jgi:tetratricopeptide (TPR) repeat protein
MLDDFQRATGDRTFSSPEEFDRHLKSKFLGKLVPHQAPRTPTERGQDLVGAAADARGRRQLQILREALKVWPDCADAYVMMAERTPDAPAARALYAQGMAAGERALGDHAIEECAGEFWSVFEARPYMRARFGFAQCCEWSGQLEEATGHYEELLRLNPSDNQGARYQLAVCLFRLKRFDRLEALLARYPEQSAQWLYVSALASFVRSGDNAESRSRLAAAYQCNRRVRKFLLGNADLPEDQPDSFRIGSEDEAVIVACELIDDWQAAAGAVAWLKAQTQTTTKRRKKRRRK